MVRAAPRFIQNMSINSYLNYLCVRFVLVGKTVFRGTLRLKITEIQYDVLHYVSDNATNI